MENVNIGEISVVYKASGMGIEQWSGAKERIAVPGMRDEVGMGRRRIGGEGVGSHANDSNLSRNLFYR